jgi:hypothetical protein
VASSRKFACSSAALAPAAASAVMGLFFVCACGGSLGVTTVAADAGTDSSLDAPMNGPPDASVEPADAAPAKPRHPIGTPLAIDDYAHAMALAFCERKVACCGLLAHPLDTAACIADVEPRFAAEVTSRSALHYDAQAAGLCEADIRNALDCNHADLVVRDEASPHSAPGYPWCSSVWRSSSKTGDACTANTATCASDPSTPPRFTWCANVNVGGWLCATTAFEGDACARSGGQGGEFSSNPRACVGGLGCDATAKCAPLGAAGASCPAYGCADGLACDDTQRCAPASSLGDPCGAGRCALTEWCNGSLCVPPVAEGAECSSIDARSCATGLRCAFVPSATKYMCRKPRVLGAVCAESFDCDEGICFEGRCVATNSFAYGGYGCGIGGPIP